MNSERRLFPRVFDADWLLLRGMNRALDRLFIEHLSEGVRVLDFGCGNMPYRPLIESCGATYLGADFGDDADITIFSDGRIDVESASVDVVVSIQVLEHVRDISIYFSEISRILKPGGVLFLSTHGTWLYHPHPEDHRRWTRVGLVNDIEANAFIVREISAVIGPLATTTLIRSIGYAFLLRRLPVVGGLLAGLVATIMNMRSWIEEKLTPAAIRNDNGCVYVTRCERATS